MRRYVPVSGRAYTCVHLLKWISNLSKRPSLIANCSASSISLSFTTLMVSPSSSLQVMENESIEMSQKFSFTAPLICSINLFGGKLRWLKWKNKKYGIKQARWMERGPEILMRRISFFMTSHSFSVVWMAVSVEDEFCNRGPLFMLWSITVSSILFGSTDESIICLLLVKESNLFMSSSSCWPSLGSIRHQDNMLKTLRSFILPGHMTYRSAHSRLGPGGSSRNFRRTYKIMKSAFSLVGHCNAVRRHCRYRRHTLAAIHTKKLSRNSLCDFSSISQQRQPQC